MKVKIGDFPNHKKNKKRKIKIKIDQYDTWNVDYTLALIIVPLLKKFKKTVHGYPTYLGNPNPYDTPQSAFDNDDWDLPKDIGFKKWKKIIDKMIWSFEQVLDGDWERKYTHGKADYKFKKIKNKKGKVTGSLMTHGKKHTLTYDQIGIQKHRERIQEGLQLFAKYFQSLWD